MIPALLADSVTYDVERAVHYALLWGLEGLELRAVGGPNDRVPFVNESRVRAHLLESDLPIVAADPATFLGGVGDRAALLNDLAQLPETLGFCRRIGCTRVVVSSFRVDGEDSNLDRAVDALRRAGEQASKNGVMICVLNEVGFAAPHGRGLARMLDAVGSGAVVAAWDPVEALRAGEDPGEGLQRLGGRVGLVRCHNGIVAGNGWEPRSIDSGEIDWPDQLERLAASGYDGPICLDVEAEPKPKIGLRDATTLIRWIRGLKK